MKLVNKTGKRLVISLQPSGRIHLLQPGAELTADPVSGLEFEVIAVEDVIPPIKRDAPPA